MVVEARLHASVKNRRAVFENLGKKLEEYNFDLAEDIQVEVILRAKQLACGDLGVRRGTVKVSKDGDSEIDYESLGYEVGMLHQFRSLESPSQGLAVAGSPPA